MYTETNLDQINMQVLSFFFILFPI